MLLRPPATRTPPGPSGAVSADAPADDDCAVVAPPPLPVLLLLVLFVAIALGATPTAFTTLLLLPLGVGGVRVVRGIGSSPNGVIGEALLAAEGSASGALSFLTTVTSLASAAFAPST